MATIINFVLSQRGILFRRNNDKVPQPLDSLPTRG